MTTADETDERVRLRHIAEFKRVGDEWVREATKLYPAGVAAICALVDGEPVGFVATSFSVGVSFDPPMVLFSVQNSSRTWPNLSNASVLGISALSADQKPIVYQLASRSRDRFAKLSVAHTDSGAVFIDGASLWLEARIMSITPAGDHKIVLLQVDRAASGQPRKPLVQHGAELWTLESPAEASPDDLAMR